MSSILIIDDDPKICLFLRKLLKKMGHHGISANSIDDARSILDEQEFDLVLLDLGLPDGNGLELLPQILDGMNAPEVIIITGSSDARGAELAFRHGAWDYVQKPLFKDELILPVTRALQYRKERFAEPQLARLVRSEIAGESEAIRNCLAEVGKVAATDASVLITGETGTGKELFARAIHENSKRPQGPFVAIDCGALPENLVESTLFGHEKGAFTGADNKQEGLLAQANGGTVLLDEVGELPLSAQKSFLRTLQERCVRPIGGKKEIPVDIRLISATNLDLDQMVKNAQFRQDLLYRIRAVEIRLPPLRERLEDIEEIATRKLKELFKHYHIETKTTSPEFFAALAACEWRGNIRELINVLEYALASAGSDPTLFPKHLPPEYRMKSIEFAPREESNIGFYNRLDCKTMDILPTLSSMRTRVEREYLVELIRRAGGDRKKACKISGMSQSRLYALLNKHQLPGFGSS